MNFPYNLFITEGIICKDSNNFKTNLYNSERKSILKKYKTKLNNSFAKNKIKTNNIFDKEDTNKLNDIYKKYIENNDINKFCNELINLKYKIMDKKEIFDKFSLFNNQNLEFNFNNNNNININSKNNNSKTNIYLQKDYFFNPFYTFNVNLDKLNKISNRSINFDDGVRTQLESIKYNKIINIKLPLIGLLDKNTKNNKIDNLKNNINKSLNRFFYHLRYYIINDSEYIKLPILNTDIENTISNILLKDFNNLDNLDRIKSIIVNNIKGISFNIKDILCDQTSSVRNKNKGKKIKKNYLIPYINKEENKFSIMKNNEASNAIKNMTNFKLHYENLQKKIAKLVFNESDDETRRRNLEIKGVKEIIALDVFQSIQIFHDIHKYYANRINDILLNYSISSDNYLKKLNFKNGFSFVSFLNKSIYKNKLILLNNFYYLFYPTKIYDNNYGILKDENGYLIIDPEAKISGDKIYEDFPFRSNVEGSKNTFKFFTNVKNNYDLYDKKELLETGIFYSNNKYLKKTFDFMKIYMNEFNKIDMFNLNIIEILQLFFRNCTLKENLNDILKKVYYFKKTSLTKNEKKIIENFIINEYQKNIKESSKSILRSLNNNISIKNKEIGLLKSNIYYIRSHFIESMIKNLFYDKNIKIDLLKKIKNNKNKYTKLLNEKIKKN